MSRPVAIRAYCSDCHLWFSLRGPQILIDQVGYEFTRPCCGVHVRQQLRDPRVQSQLLAAGARLRDPHPEPHPADAPAITHDDVLTFHLDATSRRCLAFWAATEVRV